jgi:hypothetical protein
MADLEAVLADVSYLMAMEKSKSTPAARASKKIILPDPRYEFLDSIKNQILNSHIILLLSEESKAIHITFGATFKTIFFISLSLIDKY